MMLDTGCWMLDGLSLMIIPGVLADRILTNENKNVIQ